MRLKLALFSILAATMAAGAASATTLRVALDHSTRLAIAGHAASVIVSNPAVADVTVVDSRTVYVSGRGMGSTDVTVLDPLGRVLFSGDIAVGQAGSAVSVFRGADRTDLACGSSCVATHAEQGMGKGVAAPLVGPLTPAPSSAPAAPAPAPATP